MIAFDLYLAPVFAARTQKQVVVHLRRRVQRISAFFSSGRKS
jgi:hypothetical protein